VKASVLSVVQVAPGSTIPAVQMHSYAIMVLLMLHNSSRGLLHQHGTAAPPNGRAILLTLLQTTAQSL
jgi:hypothetical protein